MQSIVQQTENERDWSKEREKERGLNSKYQIGLMDAIDFDLLTMDCCGN